MRAYTHHVPPPCNEEIRYLHIDDEIVVVVKPSGLLSVPGRFVKDCVFHRVFFDYPGVQVVHRLDLDTSGLMVLARSRVAAQQLSRQFREREVEKHYEAIVWGRVTEHHGQVDAPLGPEPNNRPRHRVDYAQGKPALTEYICLGSESNSHMLLKPRTGRSHQLRIHMAHIGHPILGCDLYAHEAAFEAASRLMLHACRLAFTHPATGEPVAFEDASPGFNVSPG